MRRQILARGTVFGVMRRVALFALVLACILLPAVAQAHTPKQYVLARPKHQHCRAGYVRKVEKGKRREHNHVRETVCVRTPSKASAKTPAKTTTIAPEATEVQCPVSAGAGGSGYTSSTARTTAVIPLPTTEP